MLRYLGQGWAGLCGFLAYWASGGTDCACLACPRWSTFCHYTCYTTAHLPPSHRPARPPRTYTLPACYTPLPGSPAPLHTTGAVLPADAAGACVTWPTTHRTLPDIYLAARGVAFPRVRSTPGIAPWTPRFALSAVYYGGRGRDRTGLVWAGITGRWTLPHRARFQPPCAALRWRRG